MQYLFLKLYKFSTWGGKFDLTERTLLTQPKQKCCSRNESFAVENGQMICGFDLLNNHDLGIDLLHSYNFEMNDQSNGKKEYEVICFWKRVKYFISLDGR